MPELTNVIPEPLTRCDRCGKHAAMARDPDRGGYVCGHCAPKVSIFALPLSGRSLEAQKLADEELENAEVGKSTREPRCQDCGCKLALTQPPDDKLWCANCGDGNNEAKVVWD